MEHFKFRQYNIDYPNSLGVQSYLTVYYCDGVINLLLNFGWTRGRLRLTGREEVINFITLLRVKVEELKEFPDTWKVIDRIECKMLTEPDFDNMIYNHKKGPGEIEVLQVFTKLVNDNIYMTKKDMGVVCKYLEHLLSFIDMMEVKEMEPEEESELHSVYTIK